MKEKWTVQMKRASFQELGEKLHVDPVVIRLIRNRGVFTEADETIRGRSGRSLAEEKIRRYLFGSMQELYDPMLMKDMPEACAVLIKAIRDKKKIRIIGDYDADGILSTYILLRGLEKMGADVDYRIPERIRDGYGLNENLVRKAAEDGREVLLTCDNGIAAAQQIALANELGLVTVVTDHHQVPFTEENGAKKFSLPPAAAVVDPHREECSYPFKELCGAGIAYKLVCCLLEQTGHAEAETEKKDLLQFAAMATITDVVDLTDENRIIVREGLKRLMNTDNFGMQALILQNGLTGDRISTYQVGFVLGPCMNATGRLDTADRAIRMLTAKTPEEAARYAADLVALNSSRKEMTLQKTEEAIRMVEGSELKKDRVLVVYLPDCHESLAGIIAGRLREHFNRPAFVLTRTESGVKGSGRSIDEYSMYDELCKCKDLLTRFGGHPMAAGLSLPEEQVEAFRRELNACCTLTGEDLTGKLKIDIAMPIDYPTMELVEQLSLLEPFGKENARPLFAQKEIPVRGMQYLGRNKAGVKLTLEGSRGQLLEAVYFGNAEAFMTAVNGRKTITIAYYPDINEWKGRKSIRIMIRSYL